jgi:selenide,water dikinase
MHTALDPGDADILFDPQTSGGLLGAVPGPAAAGVIAALRQGGAIHAAAIGHVTAGDPGRIHLGRYGGDILT